MLYPKKNNPNTKSKYFVNEISVKGAVYLSNKGFQSICLDHNTTNISESLG